MSQKPSFHEEEKMFGRIKDNKSGFRLPSLSTNIDNGKLPDLWKRFHSVRNKDYHNKSRIKGEKKAENNPIPSSFRNIKEALPIAFLKK